MKKLLFAFLFIVSTQVFAQELTGKWGAVIDGEKGAFIFDKDGYASMEIAGTVIGGKKFMMDKRACYMKYVVDSASAPFKLDLIIYDARTKKEIQRMLCIFKFMTANKMRFCASFEGTTRPKSFANKEETIVLTRE